MTNLAKCNALRHHPARDCVTNFEMVDMTTKVPVKRFTAAEFLLIEPPPYTLPCPAWIYLERIQYHGESSEPAVCGMILCPKLDRIEIGSTK